MPVLGSRSASRPDYAVIAAVIADLGLLTMEDRERSGLTRKQQASAIGITDTTLVRLETAGSNPTRTTLVTVLDYLGRSA